MALCESQLDSAMPAVRSEGSSPHSEENESPEKKPKLQPNGDIYGLNQVPGGMPLSVDYRSPVSHFVPPALEMYAARRNPELANKTGHGAPTWHSPSGPPPRDSGEGTPAKRKRGRPRIDKTSPEYLANVAARKQAKEMAAVMGAGAGGGAAPSPGAEKRKRGRPRVDKTSAEYLARKRAREIEALERKAKKEYRRRTTGDSAASSSAGESTPRVKRKYTKRAPSAKKNDSPGTEKVKGKRGRPRKDQAAANNAHGPNSSHQPKIRVRSNLMPMNTEPITLDSDEEPDLGSPSQASDSLSLDENLRALRHIHEKYANIDKDDLYSSHLLAANFKKPSGDDDVLSVRSSEGNASVKEAEARVEKLEDSSNSDSDSTSSGTGGSSSSSSSSSGSGSSSSSDSSDSESEEDKPKAEETPTAPPANNASNDDDRSYGAWSRGSYSGNQSSDSESDPERLGDPAALLAEQDEISESDNESADKSFQCHICRKWYSTRVTLKIHRRGHQSRGAGGGGRSRARASDRYECDCCSETFNRREKLWDHKATAHRGAMTVRCEVCRKCFEDDAELAAHVTAHTADERAGRCSQCSAVFPRYEQLRRHRVAMHGAPPPQAAGMPHACHQCGKRFSHAHSLTRHMHNHAKQLYRCVVCKASFARADQLAQHLNSHLANYKRLKP